jgi:uncharacterized membrane protein YgcG
MKRFAFLLLVPLLATATLAHAVDYPAQEGNVYDGAGMLPETAEIALEQKLLDFERATTIGIAVATVESLQGLDSDSYALNVANKWDIGDDATDNGVIVLVAKQERRLAVHFADGYERRWATRTSAHLRDKVMVPQLKAGQPDAAITRGVDELIRQLAAGGYLDKWAAGADIHQSADADAFRREPPPYEDPLADIQADKARRDWSAGFLRTLGAGLLLGLLTVFGLRGGLVRKQRRKLQSEIDELTEALTHKLTLLPNMEEKLRAGYPESMWGPALAAIDGTAMERLLYSGSKGRDNAELTRQRDGLRIAGGAVERVTELLRRAEHGRTDGPRLLRELTPALGALRPLLQNPDVLPETAALLEPLEVRQSELQARIPQSDNGQFDWAQFADEVDRLVADAAGLRARAESDLAQVRQAREQLPQLMEQAEARLSTLRAQNGGRYGDVDGHLDAVERTLHGYRGYGPGYGYGGMHAHDLMLMWSALQGAMQQAEVAETTYTQHVSPPSSFSSGRGGSSGWGGGGGSSFSGGGGGGSRGGGGGSSSW